MTLSTEERRLINLYRFGSAAETAAVVRDAQADITEPDVRAAAASVIDKLEVIGEAAFDDTFPESGCCYA